MIFCIERDVHPYNSMQFLFSVSGCIVAGENKVILIVDFILMFSRVRVPIGVFMRDQGYRNQLIQCRRQKRTKTH